MNKTVILIHEIYGITDSLLRLQTALEARGLRVVLPSLYKSGYSGRDENEAYKRFYSEVGINAGLQMIDGIIEQNRDSKICLVGFSVGAAIAWLFSADRRVHSVTGFYGSRIREHLEINPAVQTNLFFCREKKFDIMPMVSVLQKKKNVSVKIIEGEHGFYSFPGKADEKLIAETDREIFRITGI